MEKITNAGNKIEFVVNDRVAILQKIFQIFHLNFTMNLNNHFFLFFMRYIIVA